MALIIAMQQDFEPSYMIIPVSLYLNRNIPMMKKLFLLLLCFSGLHTTNAQIAVQLYDRSVKRDTGDYQAAIRDLTQAIIIHPGDARSYVMRAYLRGQHGDMPGALDDVNKGIALDSMIADAYRIRCQIRRKQNDYGAAMADVNRAIILDPTNTLNSGIRGRIEIDQSNYAAGIRDLDSALRSNPDIGEFYSSRAIGKLQTGNKSGAISDANRAVQVTGDDPSVYMMRGLVRFQTDDDEGCIADLTKVIALGQPITPATAPAMANVYCMRARAHLVLGHTDAARKDVLQALKTDPASDAYYYLGRMELDRRNFKEAIAYFDKAIKVNASKAEAYSYRGNAEMLLDRKKVGCADMQKGKSLGNHSLDHYMQYNCK